MYVTMQLQNTSLDINSSDPGLLKIPSRMHSLDSISRHRIITLQTSSLVSPKHGCNTDSGRQGALQDPINRSRVLHILQDHRQPLHKRYSSCHHPRRPGSGHEYLLPFGALWHDHGLPVIFYDQIGCASSTHLRGKAGDESFWQEQLFQDELDNLLDHLRLRQGSGFHILGQSWGGMLGAAFAARRPEGLRRLVLASGLASKELADLGVERLIDQMPPDMKRALDEAKEKNVFDGAEYKSAMNFYHRNFVCRADPFPPVEMLASLHNVTDDTTVYRTMYGPSPLIINGSLRTWTVVPQLANISAPTLVYNGVYDTSHDVAQVPFFELIPRVRWITFPGSGHMCHLEDGRLREKVLRVVGDFLTQEGGDIAASS
ncbi:Alpha/Beta hydrolase protein [Astrocystis sublimbata]|nr:Alpha/Beta hydrolase protein [Astrocystis sublimbata]